MSYSGSSKDGMPADPRAGAFAALEPLEPRLLLSGDLWITEFMAINDSTLQDSDGHYPDWIEIFNASGAAVDLEGYYLTDRANNLDMWRFPSVTMPPAGFLVVFASGKDRTDPAGELHTNFKLGGSGEYLALVQPDGETVEFEYAPMYPPQTADVSYGIIAPGEEYYFSMPTPGMWNMLPNAGMAEYSVLGGTFISPFEVTLTSMPGTTIHYSTDGSAPTSSSSVYTGPITITSTSELRTMVTGGGLADGPTAGETYIRLAPDIAEFNSNLPLVVLDTHGSSVLGTSASGLTFASGVFIDVDPLTERAALTGAPDYAGRSGMRIRGSSSSSYPKKQYRYEVWDQGDQGMNVSLFGMPADDDWVLHAPYSDKTLMRNYLGYKWFNDLGNNAVRTVYCEVFLNTSGSSSVSYTNYVGVYILMERIEIHDDRVVADDMPLDPTSPATRGDPVPYQGGFIIQKEAPQRLGPSGTYFNPLVRTSDNWVYIDPRTMTQAQKNYVRAKVDRFENILWNRVSGAPYNDPDLGYAAYAHVPSFIDFELIQQLCNNNDAWFSSAFAFLNKDDKLEMGPIWDLNIALGNHSGTFGSPEGWQAIRTWGWWPRLFTDVNFEQAWIDRWFTLREGMLSIDQMMADIDATVELLSEAQARDQARWNTLGTYVWPNPDGYASRTTYQSEIDFLKDWLVDRVNWIDAQYTAPPAFSQANVPVDPGTPITMYAPTGTIYYTLDGSDPRLPGGAIGPGAIAYSPGATTLETIVAAGSTWKYLDDGSNQGTAWIAPSFDDSDWASGPAPLGYAQGEATTVSFGPDSSNKYITTYFRLDFNVVDASEFSDLVVRVRRDDGAVIYLNGVEIVRTNMPTGTITYTTRAAGTVRPPHCTTYYEYLSLNADLLVDGVNTLAASAHQAAPSSSDLVFDMVLLGSVASAPEDGIPITGNTVITARTRSGSSWSAPRVARYGLTTPSSLAVTELNYHPLAPTPAEAAAGFTTNDFEFIELQNVGGEAFNLAGFALTDGIYYEFAPALLEPGEYVVLVRNLEAFRMRYGAEVAVAGVFSGGLRKSGETIELQDNIGRTLQVFRYKGDGSWPTRSDGLGSTLEVIDPFGDYDDPANWRVSGEWLGTPGGAGAGWVGDVVINEVLAHTRTPVVDVIELYNAGEVTVDLGGWYLSDRSEDYFLYRIPDGTLLAPGAYLVFDEHDFNVGESGFALSRFGEEVWLIAADADGTPTRFVDHVEFGASFEGMTFGRYPNGSGELTAMAENRLGSANSGPLVSPVVISEIHYHPAEVAGVDEADLEYVELHNHTDSAVRLDWYDADGDGVVDADEGGWALTRGVRYDFPEGASIPAGGRLIVVGFDPADAAKLEAFGTVYALPALTPGVDIVGPWEGRLSNSGERVQLSAADAGRDDDVPPMVSMDEVRYGVAAPWPDEAGGAGLSLHRVASDAFGNFVDSWVAASPAPGALGDGVLLPGDINGDGHVDIDDFGILKQNFGRTGITRGEGDLNGDGVVDLDDFVILKRNFGASVAGSSVEVVAEARAAVEDDSPDAPVLEEVGDWAWSLCRSRLPRWRRSGIGQDTPANAVVDLLAVSPLRPR